MKLVPKADRVKETINATLEDVKKLYKVAILYKLTMHYEKKIFKKEKELCKEAHDLHQKTINSVKCKYTFDNNSYDPMIYTVDDIGIAVGLKKIIKTVGQSSFRDEDKEIQQLCLKHDRTIFEIIPVFEKIVGDFWLYD